MQQITVTLPAPVAPGATIKVAFDYSLALQNNSGLAAISGDGAQFLPLSLWYPSPNSPVSVRGADTAPVRLTVNAAGGETVVSSGQASGATFDQKLSAQPFFVAGRWDAFEGANDARGVTAMLPRGATPDERKRAEALTAYAAAARAYFSSTLGGAQDAPLRLVAVNRAAGFDMGGTILVEPAVFRRAKLDGATALLIAEAIARLWIGGASPVRGAGAGVVREGLTRMLAVEFIEKHLGAESAESERLRERVAFAAVARRDAPLSQITPGEPNYLTLAAGKGAMVWRLAGRTLGREAFMNVVRAQLQGARAGELTLASLRAALAGAGGERLKSILDAELDQPTLTDLLVGLAQQREGGWSSALRNTAPFDVTVAVAARTDRGERLTTEVTLKASDFGEAIFKTASRVVGVEIDPDKLYPQTDYDNDEAPRRAALASSLDEATRSLTSQDYARAETLARELLARQPLMQDARVLLARALLEQNKLPDAEREFRAAADSPLPLAQTLAWSAIGLGEIALRKGQASVFSKGIVGNQPEVWQTKVLRTEAVGGDRVAADVQITARTLGRDQSGTAVLVFTRASGRLLLAEIPIFEVR
ncbi:MAG: hypothetical protein LC774_14600 [Acidobacteria bacterium]|nr:hypothetical protein [Acidobacteriota bacterium]